MKESENPIEIVETRAMHPASQGHASTQKRLHWHSQDGCNGRDGDSVDPRAPASRAGGPGRRQLNHPTSRAWGLGTIGRRATARVAVDPAGGPGERVQSATGPRRAGARRGPDTFRRNRRLGWLPGPDDAGATVREHVDDHPVRVRLPVRMRLLNPLGSATQRGHDDRRLC